MPTIQDLARLIARRVLRANPITPAVIVEDLGLINGTPTVLVQTGNAIRRAIYLSPLAVQVGHAVFVTRTGPGLTEGLACIATNYQIGPVALADTTWGDGPPGVTWGGGTGTWGEGEGTGAMPTTTTHFGWEVPTSGDGQAAAELLLSAVFAAIDQTLYELSLSGGGAALTVEEEDGSPTDGAVDKLVFPNGTLTFPVAGEAHYQPGSSGHQVVVNGVAMAQRGTLEFIGDGIVGLDHAGGDSTIVLFLGPLPEDYVTYDGDPIVFDGSYVEWGG